MMDKLANEFKKTNPKADLVYEGLNLNKEYKTSGATIRLPLMFYCLVIN